MRGAVCLIIMANLCLVSRRPQRVTITINYKSYSQLVTRSTEEGRSLSNLIAYLLDRALDQDSQSRN